MIRDDVAINNERVKLVAGFLNALGLALIGVGVLAPLIGPAAQVAATGASRPPASSALPQWPLWLVMGLVLHGTAHYVLGYLKRAEP